MHGQRIASGTPVKFTFRGAVMTGTVVDAITFNGKVRHGVRVDGPTDIDPTGCPGGRVYDVWPAMNIRPL